MKTTETQLKEIWEGYFSIKEETATCMYLYHHHSIVQIKKNTFSHRILLFDVTHSSGRLLELNDGVVINCNSNLTYIDSRGNITKLGLDLSALCVAGNDIIAYNNKEPYTLHRITLTGKEVWKQEIGMDMDIHPIYLLHDGMLYFHKWDPILYRLTLDTGKLEHFVDFSKHYGGFVVFNLLAIYNNNIIIDFVGKIIGVDIQNGSIEYTAKTWISKPDDKVLWPGNFRFLPVIYKNKLYLLDNQVLVCYDLQQHTSKVLKTFTQAPDGVKVVVENCTLYGNKIYYTGRNPDAAHWEYERNRFGVFDIDKEEIVYQTILPFNEKIFVNRRPVVSENYIYLNPSDNKLYIFECQ